MTFPFRNSNSSFPVNRLMSSSVGKSNSQAYQSLVKLITENWHDEFEKRNLLTYIDSVDEKPTETTEASFGPKSTSIFSDEFEWFLQVQESEI